MLRYDFRKGVRKIKTKTGMAISAGVLGAAGLGLAIAIPLVSHADSMPTITFEPNAYHTGDINGQQSWSKTGAYDAAVVSNTYGISSFGTQSLRISNAVTSGSFGDQTFAPKLTQWAGEPGAWDNNNNQVASPQPRFEAQFNIASTTKAEQTGMALSVSPDNGVGGRMSYLRFQDNTGGIDVFFDDVEGTSNPANFVESKIATLSYSTPHAIKFSMDFNPGPSNDVVKIYIDSSLVKTGTSWENYYRFDSESNPTLVNVSRTVDTMLFREGGIAVPTNVRNGYLIDNLSYLSGPRASLADQCKNNGWKSLNDGVKTFKNQGDCVSFFATNGRNMASGQVVISTPTITSPLNNSIQTSAALVKIDWTESISAYLPVTYQYRAFADSGYTNQIYDSGPTLTSSEIPTPGTPDGTYYIQVRAIDSLGNTSNWSNDASNPYVIIVAG